MPPRHPIPYSNPPYTRDESSSSDVSSDFPPIRERESSPVRAKSLFDATLLTVQEQLSPCKSAPQLLRHSQRLKKGVETAVRDAKNVPKSSSKRGREHLDTDGHHPLKKCRVTPLDTHDMEWLKGEVSDVKREIRDLKREISDMKEDIMGIGEYLKEEVGLILSEVVYLLREPQDI